MAVALLLDDGASAVAVVLVSSVRVAMIEPSVMGRVMAAQRLVSMGAIPLGALSGGVLGGAIGYRGTLVVGAGLMLLSVPAIACPRIFGMRELPARRVGVGLTLGPDGRPMPA